MLEVSGIAFHPSFLSSLSVADDIPRADEVRALVKDLWDLRIAKLRKSVNHMVTEQETYGKVSVAMVIYIPVIPLHILQLDNLTIMEINTIRQLLTESLNHTHLLRIHASHHATAAIPDQF
jgi:GINS complex subunit 2